MPDNKTLSRLIRASYPFPISHAYTYLESRIDPADRYQALLACFEATLKTVTSIALANFIRDIQREPGLGNTHLYQDLLDTLRNPLSLGHWHQLLHWTLRPYANRRQLLVVPQLFDFYYRVTEQGNVRSHSQHVRIIQSFIQERNEEAHHRNRSQVGPLQRASRVKDLHQDLIQLLQGIEFLADYPLLCVQNAEHTSGTWRYRANYASGSAYPFPQQTWETTLVVNTGRCILVDRDKPATLELDPIMIVTEEGRLQQPDIFFFDGLFSSGRANFLNYHVGDYIDSVSEGSPASVANDAIHSLLQHLENRIPAADHQQDPHEVPPSPGEIYRQAFRWSVDHKDRQAVSLEALREILNLPREEAIAIERELETERGVEVEPESETPFEGEPTWANLAYYVLDSNDQDVIFYRDLAAAAEAIKDQYDPDWKTGDSENVATTISAITRSDPRFYRPHRGFFSLTKHNELLSNPSWANLAYFVLQKHDPKDKGMHVSEITKKAVVLKEKHSTWKRRRSRTPKNTLSATMSMDHRFEPAPGKGKWRLTSTAPTAPEPTRRPPEKSLPSVAYTALFSRLESIAALDRLPFGRTYYSLGGRAHLMFRFSRLHDRNEQNEFFLGVTPQYFERIRSMGHGFVIFVLGTADNVLVVPAQVFASWVQDLAPSGSGTWPFAFYQTYDRGKVERWVRGEEREDVSEFLNNFDSLYRVVGR